jgi:hypothetical protein
MRARSLSRYLALVLLITMACKKDSTGPSVSFEDLPDELIDFFCIRGDRTNGQSASGSVSSSDCDAAFYDPNEVGYFEMWRIKVATNRSVTFTTDAAFDATLTLLRIDSYTSTSVTVTVLGFDDDSGSGLNAMLSFSLVADTNYLIVVAGYDYSETGTYTLAIQ